MTTPLFFSFFKRVKKCNKLEEEARPLSFPPSLRAHGREKKRGKERFFPIFLHFSTASGTRRQDMIQTPSSFFVISQSPAPFVGKN